MSLVFFDLTSSKSYVNLPPTFEGKALRATIIHQASSFPGAVPLYFNVKFHDLSTDVIRNSLSNDSIPVPTSSIAEMSFPVNLVRGRPANSRIQVELTDPTGAPLTFTRVCLWLLVELEPPYFS